MKKTRNGPSGLWRRPILLLSLALVACSEITTVALEVDTVEIQGATGGVILVNSSTQLNAVAKGRGFTLSGRTASWSSSHPSIASVDPSSGVVTGISAGTVDITATVEGRSQSRTFEVRNPTPTLTSLSHTSVTVGAAGFTLTATGTGFVSDTRLRLNGADRATTVVSSTQLTTVIPASSLTTAQTIQITAYTPTPGAGESNALTITVATPAPTLTSIDPTTIVAGSATFTLTVNGSNFINGTTVRVNGSNRTTSYVSATRLTATIPASDVAAPGNLQITAFTPAPGGGTSNAITLTVTAGTNPVPVLTTLTPADFPNAGGRNVVVTGSNFVASSVVRWNGSDRTTAFVSPTQLIATLNPSDIATSLPAQITVFTPAPGGGTSAQRQFTVFCPSPTIPFPSVQNASLSSLSCVAGFGQLFNLYRFTVASTTTLTLTMQSSQFDAAIELYDSDFLVGGSFFPIAFDDDSGGGTNARVVLVLAPGEYYIAALAVLQGQSGAFTLTLAASAADLGADLTRTTTTFSGGTAPAIGKAVSKTAERVP